MSRTRIRGFREEYGSWKTICILRRSRRSSPPASFVTSRPSKNTRPASGSIRRIATRPNVVLPHPDSPTSPTVCPGKTSIDAPSTACTCSISEAKNDCRTGNVL